MYIYDYHCEESGGAGGTAYLVPAGGSFSDRDTLIGRRMPVFGFLTSHDGSVG